MYISVPKNYSGNAFRPGMTGPMPVPVMPAAGPVYGEGKPQPQPTETPVRVSQNLPVQPASVKIPEANAQKPESEASKETACAAHESAPEDTPDCRKESCGGCAGKGGKNPLTCLFEALRGRGEAGFDLEDFLLIGLIVLLMGKEGNEDIVLILAMLLLI